MTGLVVWLTGLPQAGKSTLAARLRDALAPRHSCVLLDSDEVRDALGADRYDHGERGAFYRALAALAALLARQGHVVVVAATAAARAHRERARALAPRYLEAWVRTPIEECEQRDRKGLYARARAGQAPHLPGVGAVYEPPSAPDVVADGGHDERALAELVAAVERARAAPPP